MKKHVGPGKMTQLVEVLAAKPDHLNWTSGTRKVDREN